MKTLRFQDKVAIVTGSSRGIGKATAIELAKNGASVILNGRDQVKLARAEKEVKVFSEKVITVCCDVSEPDQAKILVEKAVANFGKLDILINNAAVSMRGNFSELNPNVFKTVFKTNVLGVVNCTIPALPHIRQSQGSIVFISSLAGIRGLPFQSAYCSSKMALRAIAESLRIEENKSKIHVGLILVGVSETEPEKKIISSDGTLITLKESTIFREQALSKVVKSILRNIRKRRYRSTLTGVGKVLAACQQLIPQLVERLVAFSNNNFSVREYYH